MNALTWIAPAFFVGSLITTRVLWRRTLVNPVVCFFGLWTLEALLYQLDEFLGFFTVPLNAHALLLFTLSFACFFVAALVGMTPLSQESSNLRRIGNAQLDMLSAITRILFLIFVAGVAWKFLVVVGSEGFTFQHLAKIREAANSGQLVLPFLSRAMTLAGYVVVMNLAVLLVFRPGLGMGIAVLAAILLSFVNDSTVGMRGSTLNAFLLLTSAGVLAVGVRRGRTSLEHLLAGAVVLVAGIVLLSVILYLRSGSPISFIQRLLTDNYLAMAGVIPSSSYFVLHPWPTALPCQWTCYGLYQIVDFPLKALFGSSMLPPDLLSPSAPIIQWGNWVFNSSSYLTYFYADGQALGVGLFSAFMGYVSSRTFARAMLRGTLLDIQIAAMMLSLVIFTVRGVLNGVMFWASIVFLIVQHEFVQFVGRDRVASREHERAPS